jgi:hypothetical protein
LDAWQGLVPCININDYLNSVKDFLAEDHVAWLYFKRCHLPPEDGECVLHSWMQKEELHLVTYDERIEQTHVSVYSNESQANSALLRLKSRRDSPAKEMEITEMKVEDNLLIIKEAIVVDKKTLKESGKTGQNR